MKETGSAAHGRPRRTTASRRTALARPPAVMLLTLAIASALVVAGRPLHAQDTTSQGAMDSLRARVERLEEALSLLRQQQAAQAASEVRSRSRTRLEFSGRVAATGFYATRRVNNLDVPQLVLPAPATNAGPGEGTMGATLRQSLLGLAVSGATVFGQDVSADIDMDFAGGAQSGAGGRGTFPTPRLRTARAFLRGEHSEIEVGHDVPLVLGLNPVSVASVSTPLFANAGNPWLWLTQLRVTRELAGHAGGPRIALQGATLAPNAGEAAPTDPDAVDLAERARRPFLQARARFAWGETGEIGVGVHQGWLRRPTGELVSSRAVGADARIPLGILELRGEGYVGQALRGLGGGGIGQNFGAAPTGATLAPVLRDRGGWAQLNAHAGDPWLGGAGCGIDDPDNADGPARRRNMVCAAHLSWRPGGGWVLGAEAKRLGTEYAAGTRWGSHGAVVLGVEF